LGSSGLGIVVVASLEQCPHYQNTDRSVLVRIQFALQPGLQLLSEKQ
jgi:hypothetical protein